LTLFPYKGTGKPHFIREPPVQGLALAMKDVEPVLSCPVLSCPVLSWPVPVPVPVPGPLASAWLAAKTMSTGVRPLVSDPAVKASKNVWLAAGICARACASASNCSVLVMVRPGFIGAYQQGDAPLL